MLDKTDDVATAAENWLAQFETALGGSDDLLLKTLFHPDSYWRDVLALSWNIQTVNGADAILKEMKIHGGRPPPGRFCDRPRPRVAAPGDARRHQRHRGDFQVPGR